MKLRLIPFAIVAVLAFSSCRDQLNGPNSTASAGTLTGTVTLGSEWGFSPGALGSSAGVTIVLDNTSLSTTSDSTGYWKLENVPAGNYDVTISKFGFGLTCIYGVTVQGPGTTFIPEVALGVLPASAPDLASAGIGNVTIDSTVDSITVDTEHVQELELHWNTPLDRDWAGLCVYLDKDSLEQPAGVHLYSVLNGASPWQGWFDPLTSDTTVPFSTSNSGLLTCSVSALHAAGILSGTRVYITLAQYDPYTINGAAPNNTFAYYDPVHNQQRLISPSPRSNVIAVTIP